MFQPFVDPIIIKVTCPNFFESNTSEENVNDTTYKTVIETRFNPRFRSKDPGYGALRACNESRRPVLKRFPILLKSHNTRLGNSTWTG